MASFAAPLDNNFGKDNPGQHSCANAALVRELWRIEDVLLEHIRCSLLASSSVELRETCFHALLAATSAVNDAERRIWCCEPTPCGQSINFEDQLRDGMNARGVHLRDFIVDGRLGDDLSAENSVGHLHIQACELGALEQHLPAVEADGADFCVLTHEPSPRQCDPHQLAFLVALARGVLAKTVRQHCGRGDPVIRHFLVPRTQARLHAQIVKHPALGVPVVRKFGLGHREVVGIRGQAVLRLIRIYLLLGASQKERAARVLDIERDTLFLEVSERAEQVALCRPPVGSAEV